MQEILESKTYNSLIMSHCENQLYEDECLCFLRMLAPDNFESTAQLEVHNYGRFKISK